MTHPSGTEKDLAHSSTERIPRGIPEMEWIEAVFQRCAPADGYALDPKRFTDIKEWTPALREKLLELLCVERPSIAPEIIRLGTKECRGYIRHDIRIAVTPLWQIPKLLIQFRRVCGTTTMCREDFRPRKWFSVFEGIALRVKVTRPVRTKAIQGQRLPKGGD